MLIPITRGKIYFNETHNVITTEKFEGVFLKKISISNLYLTSKRAVKEGEWMIDGSLKVRKSERNLSEQEIRDSLCVRIELTNDSELVLDDVPAIPEFGIVASNDNKTFERNFLGEFVRRYNKKDNHLDKLSEELYQWSDPNIEGDITRSDCKLLVEWFKIKLQSTIVQKKEEIEMSCELHPRPITFGHNEIGEEGKDFEWSVEPYEGLPIIYFDKPNN